MIELRSDTLTKPSAHMLDALLTADVGDDCYAEDQTVQRLESYCADLFGKASALFMPSGTMSNQVAIRALTNPGDEVLIEAGYHVNFFESSQTADLAKITLNSCTSEIGLMDVGTLSRLLDRKARWSSNYAQARLLVVENTVNSHGGRIFPLYMLKDLFEFTRPRGISIFMDGARLLNAVEATGVSPRQYAQYVDALTICFSKGLCAPFGSMLVGKADFVDRARKFRKWYGGALHQSGYMAAIAQYAIVHNRQQLAQDNRNAARLARLLSDVEGITVQQPETNIILIRVSDVVADENLFVAALERAGVRISPWTSGVVRLVTSSCVDESQIEPAADLIISTAVELRMKSQALAH